MARARHLLAAVATTVAVTTVLGSTVPASAAATDRSDEAAPLTLDTTYAPSFVDSYFGAPAQVIDLIKLDGGAVLATGRFNEVDGTSRTGVVKLLADGSVDPSFATTGDGLVVPGVEASAVQPDGKILLGGSLTTYDGVPVGHVVRLNADGTLDDAFSTVGTVSGSTINALAVQADGKILAGIGGGTIVRLNADGSVDPTFSTAMTPQVGVSDIVVRKNGDIYISGGWSFLNGVEWRFGLARLNTDGSTDLGFDPRSAVSSGYLLDIDVAHGVVIGGGDFRPTGAPQNSRLRAFDKHGAVVPGVGTVAEPDRAVISVSQRRNGKVLIGGLFTTVGGQPRHEIAQLNADGTLDSNDLGTGADNGQVWATLPASHGGILLGGNFTSVDGTPRLALAKYSRGS